MFGFDCDHDPIAPSGSALLELIGPRRPLGQGGPGRRPRPPLPRPRGRGGPELKESLKEVSGRGWRRLRSPPLANPSSSTRASRSKPWLSD